MNEKTRLLLEFGGHSRFHIECAYLMDNEDRQIIVVDKEFPQLATTYIHSHVSSLPDSPIKKFLIRHERLISEGIYDECK